jgi:hypothetical protein
MPRKNFIKNMFHKPKLSPWEVSTDGAIPPTPEVVPESLPEVVSVGATHTHVHGPLHHIQEAAVDTIVGIPLLAAGVAVTVITEIPKAVGEAVGETACALLQPLAIVAMIVQAAQRCGHAYRHDHTHGSEVIPETEVDIIGDIR